MPTTTTSHEDLIAMFSEAKILVQGDDSYVIDFADAEEIHVHHEDTGEEFILTYDDIDLEHDLVYGLTLLNR